MTEDRDWRDAEIEWLRKRVQELTVKLASLQTRHGAEWELRERGIT